MAVSDMRYNEYYGVAVRQLQRALYYNKDDKADVILLYDDLSDVEGVNLKVDFAQYCDMDEVPFSADDAIRSLCERISAITHHPLSDVRTVAHYAGFGEYLAELGEILNKPKVSENNQSAIIQNNQLLALETRFAMSGSFPTAYDKQIFVGLFEDFVKTELTECQQMISSAATKYEQSREADMMPNGLIKVGDKTHTSRSLLFLAENLRSQATLRQYSLFSRVYADKLIGLPVSDSLIKSLGDDYDVFLKAYHGKDDDFSLNHSRGSEETQTNRSSRYIPEFNFSSPIIDDSQYD